MIGTPLTSEQSRMTIDELLLILKAPAPPPPRGQLELEFP